MNDTHHSTPSLFGRVVSRTKNAALMAGIAIGTPLQVYAAITPPTTPGVTGNDPIAAGKAVSKGIAEIFIYLLFIIAFIAAAWAAIAGLFQGLRKGEWGQFAVGLGSALIMLIFVGWVLSQGETALANFGA